MSVVAGNIVSLGFSSNGFNGDEMVVLVSMSVEIVSRREV